MYTAAELQQRNDAPAEDHIVVLRNMTWADFKRLLEARGEHSAPRLCFLDGAVQIMSPSRPHEVLKSLIGSLVETWCVERGIEYERCGSWTLENESSERGAEPDDCFVFGDRLEEATHPSLAIEVIWTRGGLSKLDIYRKVGVREVWYWRKGRLQAYALRGEEYVEVHASEVLPGIDLARLASLLDRSSAQAILALKAAIRKTDEG